MQLPLIERLASALFEGTKTLARGEPIGDAIGPWTVANMIDKGKAKDIGDDIIMANKNIDGRKVMLIKAKGNADFLSFLLRSINTESRL